eukprot:m.52089 g.52089  ORF g.52089 m.52089 type:complete len:70 (-) comp11283_c0_seq1:120-329(-)
MGSRAQMPQIKRLGSKGKLSIEEQLSRSIDPVVHVTLARDFNFGVSIVGPTSPSDPRGCDIMHASQSLK